jgi:hypothetical protein
VNRTALVALMVIFVGITQALSGWSSLAAGARSPESFPVDRDPVLGWPDSSHGRWRSGGVYLALGRDWRGEARHQRGFIWWIINRLLFLAGVARFRDLPFLIFDVIP